MSTIFCKQYSNVSKAVITQALGLQKNYIEEKVSETSVIDREATGCSSCERYILEQMSEKNDILPSLCKEDCNTCPKRRYKTQALYTKRYINEKNRYGYKPRLKLNSIKLLLTYYFLSPDKNGVLKEVDLLQLSDALHCNIKTIKNNNETLKEYGYLCYTKLSSNKISLYIPSYSTMYNRATEGGSGYFVMSKSLWEALLNIESLNAMRITLRQIMELDDGHSFNAAEKTYRELKKVLPDYCKPGIIKKAVLHTEIFDVSPKTTTVRFVIKDMYNAKKIKEQEQLYFENELLSFFIELNKESIALNNGMISHFSPVYHLFEKPNLTYYDPWVVTREERTSIAALCVQYGSDIVIENLAKIYHTYILSNNEWYENLGGLLRTLIIKDLSQKSADSSAA